MACKSDESPQASGIRNFRLKLAVMTELRIANQQAIAGPCPKFTRVYPLSTHLSLALVSNSSALPVSRKTRLAYPVITTGTHQTYHASLPQTGHTRHESLVSPNTPKKTLTSC
jgi:hypothetical protein